MFIHIKPNHHHSTALIKVLYSPANDYTATTAPLEIQFNSVYEHNFSKTRVGTKTI